MPSVSRLPAERAADRRWIVECSSSTIHYYTCVANKSGSHYTVSPRNSRLLGRDRKRGCAPTGGKEPIASRYPTTTAPPFKANWSPGNLPPIDRSPGTLEGVGAGTSQRHRMLQLQAAKKAWYACSTRGFLSPFSARTYKASPAVDRDISKEARRSRRAAGLGFLTR